MAAERGKKLPEKFADQLIQATELKESGNELFRKGQWKKAIRKYHYGLMYVKSITTENLDMQNLMGFGARPRKAGPSDEEKSSANELFVLLSNNIAACLMKTEEWEKVVFHTGNVLGIQPSNPKALFRRGVANLHLNRLEEAESDLRKAKNLSTNDKAVLRQIAKHESELQVKRKESDKKEKVLYTAMFKQS